MRLLIIILLNTSVYCVGQQKLSLPKKLVFKSQVYPAQTQKPTVFVKPDFTSSRQGYVCRQEWKFEKKTGFPIRIRLGSLDYVNKMEGKWILYKASRSYFYFHSLWHWSKRICSEIKGVKTLKLCTSLSTCYILLWAR